MFAELLPPKSVICRYREMKSGKFDQLMSVLGESRVAHRKLWEYFFIVETLRKHRLLREARRGIGFGVGSEPLASYFASCGVEVLATDLASDDPDTQFWRGSNQLAEQLEHLNHRGICSPERFLRNVTFTPVDMRSQSFSDLGMCDFVWSTCAFEHLGSLDAGRDFVLRSMENLKPGGIAVHTTEFNVSSNDQTVDSGPVVVYRRRDIEDLVEMAKGLNCETRVSFKSGSSPQDNYVDLPPYQQDPHLKLRLGEFTITSIGLAFRKSL